VTDDSGIVTAHSGHPPKSVTMGRNGRSRCSGIRSHETQPVPASLQPFTNIMTCRGIGLRTRPASEGCSTAPPELEQQAARRRRDFTPRELHAPSRRQKARVA
jgi:hypothetical protein